MSTNGVESDDPFAQFSENELIKFERLFAAEEAHKKSKIHKFR